MIIHLHVVMDGVGVVDGVGLVFGGRYVGVHVIYRIGIQ